MLTISCIANIATIIGVTFAIIIYRRWKRDYQQQQAHVYALDLLKKMKILHHTIEQLRAPKFHHPDKLIEDIETQYLPKIQEILLPKVIEIDSDLLIAKNILSAHKNLQEEFNTKIKDSIMKKINMAVYSFSRSKKIHNFDVRKCDLFSIIFPSEVIQNLERMFKPSILGTGQEIINDDFNKLMEESFQPIYTMLEENLIQ